MPPIDCWAFAEEQGEKPAPEEPPAEKKPKAPPKPQPPAEPVPIQAVPRAGGAKWLKPTLIGGGIVIGVAGLALLFFFVFLPMFGGGMPGWTADYMPYRVTSVTFTDHEKRRRGGAYDERDVDDQARNAANTRIDGRDVAALFTGVGEGATLSVIRTVEDIDLEDVIGRYERDAETELKDMVYVKFTSGAATLYACKTANRTFAITSGNKAKVEMEDLIDKLDAGEREEVPEELQKVLDYVGSETFSTARLAPNRDTKWEAQGSGSTRGSSYRTRSMTIYVDERDAEDEYKDQMDKREDAIKDFEDAIDRARDDRDRDAIEALMLYEKAQNGEPELSGTVLRSSGSVRLSTLRDLLGLRDDDPWEEIMKEINEARRIYNEVSRRNDRDRDRHDDRR